MTLAEMLVALALLVLLVTMLSQLLVPAFRQSVRISGRGELQQLGVVVSGRVVDDLQSSAPEGITVIVPEPGRTLLVVHPLETVAPDGTRVWADELVLYVWQTPTLTRSLYRSPTPGAFTGAPFRPTLEQVEAYLEHVVERRVLLRDLVSFELVIGAPAELTFELARPVGGTGKSERLTLVRKLRLQNG